MTVIFHIYHQNKFERRTTMKTLSIALLAVAVSFFLVNDSFAQGKIGKKMPS
jgi:hypothetical protein